MFGMDNYWLVSEALLALTFIVFLITFMLIPNRKKVMEEGKELPGWAPAVLITLIFFAVGVGIVAFLTVEKMLAVILSDIFVIFSILITLIDYYMTKRARDNAIADMASGRYHPHAHQAMPGQQLPHHAQTQQLHGHHQAHLPSAQNPHTAPAIEAVHIKETSQPAMMTVECPNCQGHIEIPEGSHTIICPYCGLSGTM